MKIENRIIEVSNDKRTWYKRVLVFIKNYKAICWQHAETLEKAEDELTMAFWDFWREIPKSKYRPFTWEEREKLRGKWIKSKSDKYIEEIITTLHLDEDGIFKIAFQNSRYITVQNLLESYEFIDGSPCGVLENTDQSFNR